MNDDIAVYCYNYVNNVLRFALGVRHKFMRKK